MASFSVTITGVRAFRRLVEAVHTVIQDACFTVESNDEFQGLRLNSMDASAICLVNAQLQCTVTGEPGKSFCVNCKELLLYLKSIKHDSTLDIVCGDGDSTVSITVHEANKTKRYNLLRIEREPDDTLLEDMKVEHDLHIATNEIQEFLGICTSQKFPTVVFTFRDGCDKRKYFTMSADGDTGGSAAETYVGSSDGFTMNVASTDAPNMVIEAPPTAKVMYRESFSASMLYRFCKTSDTPSVCLGFCGAQQPIIVSFGLGREKSHVRFVLASQAQD